MSSSSSRSEVQDTSIAVPSCAPGVAQGQRVVDFARPGVHSGVDARLNHQSRDVGILILCVQPAGGSVKPSMAEHDTAGRVSVSGMSFSDKSPRGVSAVRELSVALTAGNADARTRYARTC